MARISYQQGSYLRARAFLQRYEAVGAMNEESLALGYDIEKAPGDEQAPSRYRQALMERYPGSTQAGRVAGQDRR